MSIDFAAAMGAVALAAGALQCAAAGRALVCLAAAARCQRSSPLLPQPLGGSRFARQQHFAPASASSPDARAPLFRHWQQPLARPPHGCARYHRCRSATRSRLSARCRSRTADTAVVVAAAARFAATRRPCRADATPACSRIARRRCVASAGAARGRARLATAALTPLERAVAMAPLEECAGDQPFSAAAMGVGSLAAGTVQYAAAGRALVFLLQMRSARIHLCRSVSPSSSPPRGLLLRPPLARDRV